LPVACIDIGSNTTRLLVAELRGGALRELVQERAFTRLGSGSDPIPAAKIDAAAEAVATQVRIAREHGADDVRTVGTHAIRCAPNREELCAAVERRAGVRIEVLDEADEARLAFAGATKTLDALPSGQVGVVDVGGGSTELVCGTPAEGVAWSRSFRVGSGFLADAYLHADPPSERELDRVRQHAAGVFEGVDAPRPAVAYAVGGSATSLCRMGGDVLDREALDRALGLLCERPAAEAARALDLHVERVRLLPAGVILLDAASAALGVPLRVARGGLREGVLLEALEHGADEAA
jgi:exopolyphosphatase/guanosine-5'-triphosphate,3'-diphosphate pyrophosphatase